jgi:hypothetical protein
MVRKTDGQTDMIADVIGDVFEYFYDEFALAEGKKIKLPVLTIVGETLKATMHTLRAFELLPSVAQPNAKLDKVDPKFPCHSAGWSSQTVEIYKELTPG